MTPSEPLRLVSKQLAHWVEQGLDNLSGAAEPQPIRELHIELTHRCDLKCVMCHHWETPFKDRGSVGREMTPSEIKKFISASRLLQDVQFVAVTGGEPWVRPDAVEIVALLRELYPDSSLGVLTNLWNTEVVRRKMTELRLRGVEGLWLGSSLDGLGETHDRVRGQRGAFAGFVKTLAMLREDFPRTAVSVSFTITPKNASDLWATYCFARDNGLGFGCQFVVNHEGFEAPERFEWSEGELERAEEQIDRVLEDICRSERALERLLTRPPSESRWLWNKLLFWSYLRRHGRGSPRFFDDCMAGRRYAMFDPEGNLFFCPVNKHKRVGNIREAPFDRIWESEKARDLRGQIIPCQCRCWLNCIANPILDRVMGAALGCG